MPSLYHVTSSCTRMGKIHFSTALTLDLTMWPASAVETLAGIILNVFVWYNWCWRSGTCHERSISQGTAAPSTWVSGQIYMKKTWAQKTLWSQAQLNHSLKESHPANLCQTTVDLQTHCAWINVHCCKPLYSRSICMQPYCSNWLVHYFSLVPWDEGPWW